MRKGGSRWGGVADGRAKNRVSPTDVSLQHAIPNAIWRGPAGSLRSAVLRANATVCPAAVYAAAILWSSVVRVGLPTARLWYGSTIRAAVVRTGLSPARLWADAPFRAGLFPAGLSAGAAERAAAEWRAGARPAATKKKTVAGSGGFFAVCFHRGV